MKKLFWALICILTATCIGLIFYSTTYTIPNSTKQIKSSIIQFINRDMVLADDIDIKQELNIDNKKYVLFVVSNNLGTAELIKGFNNKYKIYSTECSERFFYDEIYKTNKGKYLILKGKNYNNKIAYITASLDGNKYKINIPKQEYFMVYCKVPKKTQNIFLDSNDIKFYSNSDTDITDEMIRTFLKKWKGS